MDILRIPKNILLVEDDSEDHVFFMEALHHIANTMLFAIAENGAEAMAVLENTPILPDLIFLDINMPVMNGIDCLKAIMENAKFNNIPVVMLTTSDSQLDLLQKLGAKAYIKKPGNREELRQKLEEVIMMDFQANGNIGLGTFEKAKPDYHRL